jgi:CheY-like chemotaxis protein
MTGRRLERILHVDDDADIRAMAKLTLETLGGCRVESCESGAEALAKAPGFRPDLLLLDVDMPVLDGPTTLQELRKLPNCADVPAVFMTARAQPHDIEMLRRAGAVDVIAKPFDRHALSGQIDAIWQRSGSAAT